MADNGKENQPGKVITGFNPIPHSISRAEFAKRLAEIDVTIQDSRQNINSSELDETTMAKIKTFLEETPNGIVTFIDDTPPIIPKDELDKMLKQAMSKLDTTPKSIDPSIFALTSNIAQGLDFGKRGLTMDTGKGFLGGGALLKLDSIPSDSIKRLLLLNFEKAHSGKGIDVKDDPTYSALIEATESGAELKDGSSLRALFKAADAGQKDEALNMLTKAAPSTGSGPSIAPKN